MQHQIISKTFIYSNVRRILCQSHAKPWSLQNTWRVLVSQRKL